MTLHLTLHTSHPSTPHTPPSHLTHLPPHLRPLHTSHTSPPRAWFTLSPAGRELVLEVMQALTSNTQIVKESIQKGVYSTSFSRRWVSTVTPPPSPQVPSSTC